MTPPLSNSSRRLVDRLAVQVFIVLFVCAAVFWFKLGEGGFHSTEGHRAIPAYEMLDHAETLNDWAVPRMFEQPYLRKPPGMPWAIAAMSVVFGQTVFAARAVSALASTGMAFVSFGFARRWFGPRAAFPAGLACALMPVLWESGRAAEIEALNTLGTQIACLALLDLLVFQGRDQGGAAGEKPRWGASALAVVGIVWSFLAKGPASVPVVLGSIVAACVVCRSARCAGAALGRVLIPAGLIVGVMLWFIAVAASREPGELVTQSPSAFMFEPGMLVQVLTLPLVAFAQVLPASFGLLFPFGSDARAECGGINGDAPALSSEWTPRRFAMARALAIAWIVAVVIFMLFGVRNPRYTLPAAGLLPPLAGAIIMGTGAWLRPSRDRIARTMLLGAPIAMVAVLLVGAGIYMTTVEANRRGSSAEPAGRGLAEALLNDGLEPDQTIVVVADGVIEARPELCLAFERTLADAGMNAAVRWLPGLGEVAEHTWDADCAYALLRADEASIEAGFLTGAATPSEWSIERQVGPAVVFHKSRAALCLLRLDPVGTSLGEPVQKPDENP